MTQDNPSDIVAVGMPERHVVTQECKTVSPNRLLTTFGIAVLLSACATPGVRREMPEVSPDLSRSIHTVNLEIFWPEENVALHDYATNRNEAARDGINESMNGCVGEDCLAVLIFPIVIPFAAAGSAMMSDSAEEIADQEFRIRAAINQTNLTADVSGSLREAIEEQTPYQIVSDGSLGDGLLRVHVGPLDVSGEGMARQNVRTGLTYDVEFIRQSMSGERPIFEKSYNEFYDQSQLRDVAANISNVVQWMRAASTRLAERIAGDIYFGFAEGQSKFEINEPNTLVNCVSCNATEVDSMTPTLEWYGIEPGEIPPEFPGGQISYELRVVEYVNPERISARRLEALTRALASYTHTPVYEAEGITEIRHEIQTPLRACTKYLWEVRARLTYDEIEYVSDWRNYYQIGSGGLHYWRLPLFQTPCG